MHLLMKRLRYVFQLYASARTDDLQANDDHPTTPHAVSDDEEHIVVTRPEEDELDPEAEADFERELAKMMSESMQETRKTDRKTMPDIALPIRRAPQAAQTTDAVDGEETAKPTQPNVIKFSLLSKRGNRAQVCLYHSAICA